MKWAVLLVAVAVAGVPAQVSSAVVQFVAPAGSLPAQHLRDAVFDAVLPSGRIVTPFGASVVTGMNALGFALSPDGRYAVVSNDDERDGRVRSAVDPRVYGGYSLSVVETASMRVVDRFAYPGETYVGGVAALRDPRAPQRTLVFVAGGPSNAVYVLDLDAAGHITPDIRHVIPVADALDPASGPSGRSIPSTLVASVDGRRVYAADAGGDAVTAIDTATRTVTATSGPTGFVPAGAALAGSRLLVANEGLMRYAPVASPPLVPPFATPPADTLHASSLSFFDLALNGDFAPAPPALPALAMDPAPDGVRIVGGAHPSALAVTPNGAYAFVAMTNVDRIATVALGTEPRVVGGTELRLFDHGPYGTQPAALVLSRDGTRLYVALAGLNAVAVLDARDPLHVHRLGLIPTGWFPAALALSPDDRLLYVANTKGFGHDAGFAGDATIGDAAAGAAGAAANAVWSTLQKIDLRTVTLSETTFATLKNTRDVRAVAPAYPHALQNVVVIVAGNASFDALLGDLGYGPADPRYLAYGEAVTPNLHALARRFGLAGNFFADAQASDAAHQFLTTGVATAFSERTQFVASDRASPIVRNENPEDAPRAGSIFNALARHHVSFRDYGDLVRLAGYDDGEAADPTIDDPAYAGSDDRVARTSGLGGRYAATVPAPAVLAGHIDMNYPGWNVRIRDERRAHEFIREYGSLVRARQQPRYTHIWLPADGTGMGPDLPPAAEQVADGDRALGAIVAYLTHLRSWRHTAIFVLAGDTHDARDHVDGSRTYALVISPYARPRYLGMRHLSTVSVLKTAEQILKIPPLSLGDLLATDMSDFFDSAADPEPFIALPVPVQTAAAPGASAAGFTQR